MILQILDSKNAILAPNLDTGYENLKTLESISLIPTITPLNFYTPAVPIRQQSRQEL